MNDATAYASRPQAVMDELHCANTDRAKIFAELFRSRMISLEYARDMGWSGVIMLGFRGELGPGVRR